MRFSASVALRDWDLRIGSVMEPVNESDFVGLWQDKHGLQISKSCCDRSTFRLNFSGGMIFDIDFVNRQVANRSLVELPSETISHLFSDQLTPRLLAHEGKLVIHAGAVARGDAAVLLVGDTGSGKSTLAASLAQIGFVLLGDDALIVEEKLGISVCKAVCASLRLLPDSVKALFPRPPTTRQMAHYSDKRRVDVQGLISPPGALSPRIAALYFLMAERDHSQVTTRSMTQTDTCMALVANSFALDPTNTAWASENLNRAAELARKVPGYQLSYPRDYARLPEVHSAILATV